MKLRDHRGFSILELIAAAVILGVVCTAAIATVAPIPAKSRTHVSERELASLNAAAHRFFLEQGRHADSVPALLAADANANSIATDQFELRRIEQVYVYSPSSGRFTRK
jgi:prepilin-type N-terminal cleavage/methylation domain-containing protein